MATAKLVKDVERLNLDWLVIEDEDGGESRYERAEQADCDATVHVDSDFDGADKRAKLARFEDGKPTLQQDSPGLPPVIVVNHISGEHVSSGAASHWIGKINYRCVTQDN